jgi:hypothetical protein
MDTTELTRALRDATADVAPRHGFTAAVVRGGRRRRTRTRIVIATGATAVTALAVTSTYVLWPDPTPGATQSADPRLKAPTQGDLAGDTQFLNAAAHAWRDGLPHSWNASRGIFDDLRGTPHVYWAGNTPAGPAAVVMQQAYFHPHGDLSPDQFNQFQTLIGLVAKDPADGVLKLVYDQYQPKGFGPSGYFQFGPGDRTLLIVDNGTPLYWSATPITTQDGRVTRSWERMTIVGGVTMADVPENIEAGDIRVVARATPPAPDDKNFDGLVLLEPSSTYLKFAKEGAQSLSPNSMTDNRLHWSGEQAQLMRVGAPYEKVPSDLSSFFSDALDHAGLTDIGGMSRALGLWHVLAGLPDGRAILVSELQQDSKPSHIFSVVLNPDGTVRGGVRNGTVDPKAVLPVRVQLPETGGWIVADYGKTLRYRTAPDAPWQDAGRDAALLPWNTVQVQVGTQVVDLKS